MHPPAGAGAQPSLTAGPASSGTGQTEGPHPPSGKDVTEHDGSPGAPGAHAHDRRQRRENGGDHHQHGQPGSPRPCLSTNYCVDLQARLHGCGGRGVATGETGLCPVPAGPFPESTACGHGRESSSFSPRPATTCRSAQPGRAVPAPSASPAAATVDGTAWCLFMCFFQCAAVRKACSQNGHL